MELPENQQPNFTNLQKLSYLADRLGAEDATKLPKNAGRIVTKNGIQLEIIDKDGYDHTYKMNAIGHVAIINPDNTMIMKSENNQLELVKDPEVRAEVIGNFVTYILGSIDMPQAA